MGAIIMEGENRSFHVPLLEITGNIRRGLFVTRVNRFTVLLKYNGSLLQCHLHDPGRLSELLLPGVPVLFRDIQSPGRKTQYDILAIRSPGFWVITDSRMPNIILRRVVELSILNYKIIDKEVQCGDSRIDYLLEKDGTRFIAEVKGCTLCRGGTALFPDAPTSRGSRQIKRMLEYPGACPLLIFVVMRPDANNLRPNMETDPLFYQTLKEGLRLGLSTTSFKVSLENERIICFRGNIPVTVD
ncbi:MAG: DNA/RNA nuclease SfsA [Candidatus Methanomethyliaceae archaeon]|nr:DNA/RNA nuclease SfsA [Candidatus Methanomethyliaceae archaeon]